MKIRPEQTEKLVGELLKNYRSKELIVLKAEENVIRAKIAEVLTKNFHEEEVIEEEARQMLASHKGQEREIDHHRLFLLAKQKLAQRKGFVL